MNPNPNIKALAFDAFGTLFDVHSVIKLCDDLFPGRGTALSQMWRSKQTEYMWQRSLMEQYVKFEVVTESALIYVCKSLNVDCGPAERKRLMEAYLNLAVFPEVKEALAALSTYPLAILSVGSPEMLSSLVKNAGLEKTFAHVISADEVKIYKPSMKVYELVPSKMGVDKAAIGFVSANCWDAVGGKVFGFYTLWVNRNNAPPDELGFSPDVTLNKLTEIPKALAG